MEQLISHLITNPAWMSLSVLFVVIFLVIFGILFLSALIQMDDKKNNTEDNPEESKKILIQLIVSSLFIFFFMILLIMFVSQKISAPSNIIKNKEYTLTKNGKILTIESKNQFLPSTDLEVIYDDEKEIQVKVDNDLYTIDKQSEEIKEK